MDEIVEKVLWTCRRYRLISERDTVLAAVSGGADSVAMLRILLELRETLGIRVKAAHLDHRFRGEESRDDARFVRDLCDELDVPCFTEEVNVPRFVMAHGYSKQEAARMLRYQYLVKVMKLEYCQRIATGHTADDQAETVLMRLLRGSGPDGLSGIPHRGEGGMVIRPLLDVRREEVEAWLGGRGAAWRTDSSNLTSDYTRNRIRLELMPVLEEYNPSIRDALVRTGAIMTDVAAHLERATDEALPSVIQSTRRGLFALDSAQLAHYDEALQRSLFRRVFASLRPDLAPLASRHVDNLLELLRRDDVGASVELPGGARARLEHGRLVVSEGDGPPTFAEARLDVPGSVEFPEARLRITADVAPHGASAIDASDPGEGVTVFDLDAVELPLSVRPRRPGDRIRPFGMDGTKSLKELMIDEKIPFGLRDALPIVCDAAGDLCWVVGVRRSAAAPVTEATRRVLRVTAEKLDGAEEVRKRPSL
ncbi:MAG: tRNA lysidine(34) synthetase TilS [Candidatus Eisenbacteria bacterium]|nr:tRNA lysidine(34) synthetase TilS [Candidatus Eisenbacteria bacterium]